MQALTSQAVSIWQKHSLEQFGFLFGDGQHWTFSIHSAPPVLQYVELITPPSLMSLGIFSPELRLETFLRTPHSVPLSGSVTGWLRPGYPGYPKGSPAKRCKLKQVGMPLMVCHSGVHVLV